MMRPRTYDFNELYRSGWELTVRGRNCDTLLMLQTARDGTLPS